MEDCRMIFISDFANVTCQSVTGRTPEEEKELRDSYEVKRSVKEAHKKEMKRNGDATNGSWKAASSCSTGTF